MKLKEKMTLNQELQENLKNINTKYLVMSLREIMSMFEEEEIKINPIYQRGFRWAQTDKTYLIESLILNFPIPPIFVYQRNDGIWELVDGLQRISTVLEFFGKLPENMINENNKLDKLSAGKILTELEGISPDEFVTKHKDLALKLKKYPIHVVIIDAVENEVNNGKFEYEVFRRLNTYGARLSKQEIRNVTIALRDESLYEMMDNFTKEKAFTDIFIFGGKKADERKDLEVLLQFYLLYNIDRYKEKLNKVYDLYDLLDDISIEITREEMQVVLNEMKIYLEDIYKIVGEQKYSFQPYDDKKKKFSQGYQNHIFEIVTLLYFKNKASLELGYLKQIESYTEWRTSLDIANVKGHKRVLEVVKYVVGLLND
ncbi:MAG: DUF262 domain-containing protein [Fusobacteriaceae bacterium]